MRNYAFIVREGVTMATLTMCVRVCVCACVCTARMHLSSVVVA